ncbi:MAG: FliM/FliN family flagellar motor switch protein [Pirellulales bacterium]
MQWKIGDAFAALILPEQGGLLPPTYAGDDATTRSKLSTLAQELGLQLFPDEYEQAAFDAIPCRDLAAALKNAHPAEKAGLMALTLTSGERTCAGALIWPYAGGDAFRTPAADAAPAIPETHPKPAAATKPALKPQPAKAAPDEPPPPTFEKLPNFTRSLLKISVPVRVTLAEKRQPISSILDLGPGAIIQFEKSCEEMLDLCRCCSDSSCFPINLSNT